MNFIAWGGKDKLRLSLPPHAKAAVVSLQFLEKYLTVKSDQKSEVEHPAIYELRYISHFLFENNDCGHLFNTLKKILGILTKMSY